jgi:non-specific serine/threonine protein kinase
VGKTRLAIEVGRTLAAAFVDGTLFVSLAPVTDPELVLPTIARVIGAGAASERSLAVVDALRDRHALLVLDNVEQVVAAAAQLARLLGDCPGLTMLVTSRVPLHVVAEHRYPVAPLALPERTGEPEQMAEAEAVRLFIDRARAVDPAFTISSDNAASVAAICRRLDGLPLAVELAAAKAGVVSPQGVLARLDRTLPVLTGGPRDVPAHQRTVRETIVWSHDLLTPGEQALFRRLSVFTGGFTLDAAEAVAGGAAEPDVLSSLESLIEQSLVHRLTTAGDEPRFGMLETVREFALEALALRGEEPVIRDRHGAFFVAAAERALPPQDRESQMWTAQVILDREHPNLRAALEWFDRTGDTEALLRLATVLSVFWEIKGYWEEGIAWLERALAASSEPSPERLLALNQLALMHGYRGDFARVEQWLGDAVATARQLGDVAHTSHLLQTLGSQLVDQRHYDEAERVLAEAVAAAVEAGEPEHEAIGLAHYGIAAWGRGARAEAAARLERAQTMAHTNGQRFPAAISARYLAHLATEDGAFARAAGFWRQFWAWDPEGTSLLARLVPDVASLAAAIGEPERAARLFGVADTLAGVTGLVHGWPERGVYEQRSAAARAILGGEAFSAAFDTGRRLARGQILVEVEAVLSAAEATADSEARPYGLTPRELEVLRLLAAGRTDRQIAEVLFVSRRTAEWHVRNVLGKLGVAHRAEAASIVAREHLLPSPTS